MLLRLNKFNEEELIDQGTQWIKSLEMGEKIIPSMRVFSIHFTPQDFILDYFPVQKEVFFL